MESTPKNLMWKCFDKGDEKRKILERELPDGFDAYQKAKEFIEDYNRKSESEVASITQLESGSVVVAVVDEFSKRVHKTIVQSGQICFVDGTSSLDRMNHQLIKLMTESPSGGLPLGFLILSDQKQETLWLCRIETAASGKGF